MLYLQPTLHDDDMGGSLSNSHIYTFPDGESEAYNRNHSLDSLVCDLHRKEARDMLLKMDGRFLQKFKFRCPNLSSVPKSPKVRASLSLPQLLS